MATIEEKVIGILQSPSVLKIDFVAKRIHIAGFRYTAVVKQMQRKKGGITVSLGKPQLKKDKALGEYFSNNSARLANSFLLRDQDIKSFDDEVTIVHEATHAALDVMNLRKGLTFAESEAFAYLAETLYIKNAGRRLPDVEDETEIQEAADIIAEGLINSTFKHKTVPDDLWGLLVGAICKDPDYAKDIAKWISDKSPLVSDGVPP